jgi:hypothetical protein
MNFGLFSLWTDLVKTNMADKAESTKCVIYVFHLESKVEVKESARL